MTKQSLKQALAEAELTSEYCAESLALQVISEVWGVMEERGISQKDLANLVEKKPAFVSRVLSGPHNLTLQTIAEFLVALERRPSFAFEPLTAKQEPAGFGQQFTVAQPPKKYRSSSLIFESLVENSIPANSSIFKIAAT